MKTGCIIAIIAVVAYCLAAYFFCSINPEETYTWYSGLWHGLFWIPNLMMSLFSDSIYFKAPNCTTMYTILYYMSLIISSIIVSVLKNVFITKN